MSRREREESADVGHRCSRGKSDHPVGVRTKLIELFIPISVACASTACSGGTEAEAAPPPVELSVADVTVDDLAVALSESGVPVAIDPDASALSGCLRVTVRTGGAIPRDQAAELVGHTLEGSGLRLESLASGWVVHLGAGGRFDGCASWMAERLLGEHGPHLRGAPAPPAPEPEPAQVDDVPALEQTLAGIRADADGHVQITRAAADAILAHPGPLFGGAHVEPVEHGGVVQGLLLRNVPPHGVASALGLAEGDLLLTIMGASLASPDQALEAYTRVRAAETVPLQLRRDGHEIEIVYRIVPELEPR